MKKVKIQIYAGGGWEGHVCYRSIHPENLEIQNASSSIDEILAFCQKHNLAMDEDFLSLAKNKLIFTSEYGFIISPDFINSNSPISSASQYLKSNFPNYL